MVPGAKVGSDMGKQRRKQRAGKGYEPYFRVAFVTCYLLVFR